LPVEHCRNVPGIISFIDTVTIYPGPIVCPFYFMTLLSGIEQRLLRLNSVIERQIHVHVYL